MNSVIDDGVVAVDVVTINVVAVIDVAESNLIALLIGSLRHAPEIRAIFYLVWPAVDRTGR